MKNLLYIFSFMFLCACMDKSKMQDLKGDIQNDLDITITHNIIDRYVNMEYNDFKNGTIRTSPKALFEKLNYAKTFKKAYSKVLKQIENTENKGDYKKIYQKYRQQLAKKLKKKDKLWENVKPYLHNIENLYEDSISNTQLLKKIVKLKIADDMTKVMDMFFRRSLSGCIWFHKMGLLGINQSQKIKEGEDVKLTQLVFYTGNKPSKKYDYDTTMINQGKIKIYADIFDISIPAKKLGTQDFEVVLKLKEWETDKDTTLYFTKTFEVIK